MSVACNICAFICASTFGKILKYGDYTAGGQGHKKQTCSFDDLAKMSAASREFMRGSA